MSTPFESLPVTRSNRPGLPRVDYAPDDFATVRDRLLARLPEALPGWNPTLAAGGSDYGVLLCELFAQMAAILHAYADQRANEGFLRTATLTRSLIDLTQLIDYRLGNGASASALQAFLAKAGKAGPLPAGFKLQLLPGGNAPALVFETAASLDVHPSRNQMRLSGYNRSGRVLRFRATAGAAQDTRMLLDAAYPGLKAGVPVLLDRGTSLGVLVPTAVTASQGVTQVDRAPGVPAQNLDLAIASLTLHGRPEQTARLAAAARADEITLGDNALPVTDLRRFNEGMAVLIDSAGLLIPAVVVLKTPLAGRAPAGVLTLSRGVNASLRRSVTRIFEGTRCGFTSDPLRAGATSLPLPRGGVSHPVSPGHTVLIVDANGVEMATVSRVDGSEITLAQPVARPLRPVAHVFESHSTIQYFVVAPGDSATYRTTLRPVLLGELGDAYAGGNTVVTLERSVEEFAVGSAVVLGDGVTSSAHRVLGNENVDGRTRLTLAGAAPAGLRVAWLNVYGGFAHAMHVAGYDHAEGMLAAGASQLVIDGVPPGLVPGLDLVIADPARAEGTRIAQVQPLADRVLVSLSRPLDFAYALGDAVVYGNVVEVTQGAGAPDEVLGGGDPAAAPQRFELRRSPLTWVPDPSAPRGVAPALEILVGGERWSRVETLADSGRLDRHYVVEIDDRERATVVFGDGQNGAAPPSGRNNLVARYRTGQGAQANAAARAINKMPQAASFLERTFNPIPASGGTDRESPDQARHQARLCVRTLDRAVTVADHADLSLTFAGIAKARAAVEREGRGAGARRVIVVTCAATGGGALSTPRKEALLAYLQSRSPGTDLIRIRDYRPWPVRLALTVTLLPDFQQATVQRALGAVLGNGAGGFFGFDQRGLGVDLVLSDVYALVEATPGVEHARATLFHAETETGGVADRIPVPADALATGGAATDAAIGRLSVQLIGGLS